MDIYRDMKRRGKYRIVYVCKMRFRLKPNNFYCSCARNVVNPLSASALPLTSKIVWR